MDDIWADPVLAYNTFNFDTFPSSVVTVFQALTLEDWSLQMHALRASGMVVTGPIYYMLIVFVGSYLILNLILAVIMSSYSKFEAQIQPNEGGNGGQILPGEDIGAESSKRDGTSPTKEGLALAVVEKGHEREAERGEGGVGGMVPGRSGKDGLAEATAAAAGLHQEHGERKNTLDRTDGAAEDEARRRERPAWQHAQL